MLKNFYKKYGYLILLVYLIAAYFYMPLGLIAIVCMVAPILFAALGKGRYWCGNFCPRGNFYQNIAAKFSAKRKIPSFIKSVWFRALMILFIIGNFSYGVYKNWGIPAGIGMVFYRIIVITTIVGIVLAAFFMPRTWCSFCPMGSIAALIAKLRGRKIAVSVGESCVGCGLCAKQCPMELSPMDAKGSSVASNDCIFCENCVYACPKDAVKLS